MNLDKILIKLEKQGWKLEKDFLDKNQNFLQDLVDETEKAINYTRCCTTLPTEEEMTLEKIKTFKRIDEGIMNLDKMSYGVGFRKCFSWLSKDKDY